MSLHEWMEPARRQQRAHSFGPVAQLYDRVRPNYPAEAVQWALAPLGAGPWRVADIGAGTGIMTRRLAALGHLTIAIEPDAQMRAGLVRTTPGVEALEGSAETIPLDRAAVDAAVAAQAYHWFDPDRAHAELARIIRPGGVFAAVWNDRDESVAWLREYSGIVEGDRGPDGSGADTGRADHPSFGDGFDPVERGEFTHAVRHTPDSLVELLRSRSYFITAAPAQQNRLEAAVRDLATNHPDLRGLSDFDLPYTTQVFRAIRRPD